MRNIEELANELIRQRPVTHRKPWKRTRQVGYRRVGGLTARPLSVIEVCEFRAHVERCIDRACKAGHYCWRPNCPRCKPA